MGYEITVLVGRSPTGAPSTRLAYPGELFHYVMVSGALEMGTNYELSKLVGPNDGCNAAFFAPGGDGNTEVITDRYGELIKIYSRQGLLRQKLDEQCTSMQVKRLVKFLRLFDDYENAVLFYGH